MHKGGALRYAKALAVVTVLLCAGPFAAAQSTRGPLYQSPFADYKGMESIPDPSEHWQVLNDLAGEPDGHVDYGTQTDQGAARSGPAPETLPQPRAYMKQIVYRPDDRRHHLY